MGPTRSEGQQRGAALFGEFRRKNDGTAWWLKESGPGPYDNPESRPHAERCILGFGSVSGPPMASDALHVIEKFTRLDSGTLLYEFTVEDPKTWSKPWSGQYPWPASENRVFEYACHEGNYALGNIMRGARLLERDVEAKK